MLGMREESVRHEQVHQARSSRFVNGLSGRWHTSGVSGSMAKVLRRKLQERNCDDSLLPAGVALSLTRREEEFRADAERLVELQMRLEALRGQKAVRDRRREERESRRERYKAACKIQRCVRDFLTVLKDISAGVVVDFLRKAYAVRAVNVAAWAASKITDFSSTAKRRWRERRELREREEQARLQYLNLSIAAESLVQRSVESAIESVTQSLLSFENHRESFFLTQNEAASGLPYMGEDEDIEQDVANDDEEINHVGKEEQAPVVPEIPLSYGCRERSLSVLRAIPPKRRPVQLQQNGLMITLKNDQTMLKDARSMAIKDTRTSVIKEDDRTAAVKAVIQRICDAQREGARVAAARRSEREEEEQLRARERAAVEEARQHERRLMYAEDWRLRTRRLRPAPRPAPTTPPATLRSRVISSRGLQGGEVKKDQSRDSESFVSSRRVGVFRQPEGVAEALHLAREREASAHRQEEERSQLDAQARRREAVLRERAALQVRLQLRAEARREQERIEELERVKFEEEKARVLARGRQTVRQLRRRRQADLCRRVSTEPLLEPLSVGEPLDDDDEDDVLQQSLSEPRPLPDTVHTPMKETDIYMTMPAAPLSKSRPNPLSNPLPTAKSRSVKVSLTSTNTSHRTLPRLKNHPYAQPLLPKKLRVKAMGTAGQEELKRRQLAPLSEEGDSYAALMSLISKARKALHIEPRTVIETEPLLSTNSASGEEGVVNLQLREWRRSNPPPSYDSLLRRTESTSEISTASPVLKSNLLKSVESRKSIELNSCLVESVEKAAEDEDEEEQRALEKELDSECSSLLLKLQRRMLEGMDEVTVGRSRSAPTDV